MPKRTEARFVTFYSDDFIQRKFPMLTFFSTANSHSNEHAEWNEFLEFLSSSLSSHLLLLLIWLIISLSFNVSSMLLKLEILLLRKWCERFWTSVDTTKFWIESEKTSSCLCRCRSRTKSNKNWNLKFFSHWAKFVFSCHFILLG